MLSLDLLMPIGVETLIELFHFLLGIYLVKVAEELVETVMFAVVLLDATDDDCVNIIISQICHSLINIMGIIIINSLIFSPSLKTNEVSAIYVEIYTVLVNFIKVNVWIILIFYSVLFRKFFNRSLTVNYLDQVRCEVPQYCISFIHIVNIHFLLHPCSIRYFHSHVITTCLYSILNIHIFIIKKCAIIWVNLKKII
jgi:hypothetical protein